MPRSPSDPLLPCPFCGGEAQRLVGGDVSCDDRTCAAYALCVSPDAWNRRADQRLAAGAEAEANRREDAKSERLAGGAPNANSGSLPPLALAPGGRDKPTVFIEKRDLDAVMVAGVKSVFVYTSRDSQSMADLYLRPQPPSAPQAEGWQLVPKTMTPAMYVMSGVDQVAYFRLLRAAPSSPPSGWRPISGAQHVEGNKVLVYTIWDEHVIVRYVPNMGDGSRPWYDDDDMWLADKDIRGWQPLPPAPSSEQPKEES